MIRAALAAWVLFLAGILASTQAQFFTPPINVVTTPVSGYTGIGNVVSGATGYWGLRCYNAAYAGNVADVYAPADASHTLLTCSAGGTINETLQALSVTCAVSCTIKTLYDQSGSGNDAAQATSGIRPVFVLNAIGSLPGATFAAQYLTITSGFSTSRPLTTIATINPSASGGDKGIFGGNAASNKWEFRVDAAKKVSLVASSTTLLGVSSGTLTASTWYAVGGSYDTSGTNAWAAYIDGTQTTGTTASTLAADTTNRIGLANFNADQFNGYINEVAHYASVLSSTQVSNLSSNQHAYWGF